MSQNFMPFKASQNAAAKRFCVQPYLPGRCANSSFWLTAAWQVLVLLAALVAFPSHSVAASNPDTLTWNRAEARATADIQGAQLVDVLRRVAASSGWQVFLEPGTTHSVSAKFKNLPAGDALRLLLGDINFALIPSTNGPSRL